MITLLYRWNSHRCFNSNLSAQPRFLLLQSWPLMINLHQASCHCWALQPREPSESYPHCPCSLFGKISPTSSSRKTPTPLRDPDHMEHLLKVHPDSSKKTVMPLMLPHHLIYKHECTHFRRLSRRGFSLLNINMDNNRDNEHSRSANRVEGLVLGPSRCCLIGTSLQRKDVAAVLSKLGLKLFVVSPRWTTYGPWPDGLWLQSPWFWTLFLNRTMYPKCHVGLQIPLKV